MAKISIIINLVLRYKVIIAFFILLFVIYIVNTLHFNYPDEFDNLAGGRFITKGLLPYSGFFTHHGPVPYFISAIITLFTGASFVKFRLVYALILLIYSTFIYVYFRRRFGEHESRIVLILMFIISIAATFVWGNMLLADSLVGFLFLPAYALLVFITLDKNRLISQGDIVVLSTLLSLIFLSSITYIYALLIAYVYIAWLLITRRNRLGVGLFMKAVLTLLLPYFIFVVYLFATNSFRDYYYQAIFFNIEYYITMPDGSSVHNPLRHAISIFHDNFGKFKALFALSKDMNLSNPFNSSLAVFNFSFLIYLLLNRRVRLALVIFGFMIYLNARGDPLTTGEGDYQAIPYHYISLLNGIIALNLISIQLGDKLSNIKRYILIFLFFFAGIYFVALIFFLSDNWFNKVYNRYMGVEPLIYDRPPVASVINMIIGPTEYYYIGPFAFEDHFYIDAKPASKYHITIPAMDKSDKIKQELIADLERNRPKVIFYNTDYQIFGSHPAPHLRDFLAQNYVTLDQVEKEKNVKFNRKYSMLGESDFGRYFFIEKSQQDTVLRVIQDKGLIMQQ